jgi:ubiquitin-conjugating enzyme E2 I
MSAIAKKRLISERKNWRKEHPYGFYARPSKRPDGSNDIFRWECGIPGKKGTEWEGGLYKLTMQFPEDYPAKPPKVQFQPVLYHPNIFPRTGTVCLSILSEEKDWKAAINVRQILIGVQALLGEPNIQDPAQDEPFRMFRDNKAEYLRLVRAEALKHRPTDD